MNWNWNWKCLGEKSPKHRFFGKKKNHNFRHTFRQQRLEGTGNVGALGRRATGGLLLGLSEEQQGGLLLPGLAPGRIYSVCNVVKVQVAEASYCLGAGARSRSQVVGFGGVRPPSATCLQATVRSASVFLFARPESTTFDVLECTRGDYEFGRTCTFTALTNKECSVATGGDATA